MKARDLFLKIPAVFCAVGYVIFGLGLSGVESTSKLAALFAGVGCFLSVIGFNNIPIYFIRYISMVAFMATSWLWGRNAEFQHLGNYLTPVFGGILFANIIYLRWVSIKLFIIILLMPFIINFYAYMVGDNLVESIQNLDYDAAFKRFGGYVGHPSPLVTRLVLPLIIFVIFHKHIEGRIERLFLGLFSITSAIFVIYATGSKKSILVLLPVFFIYLILQNKDLKFKNKYNNLFFRSALVVFIIFLFFSLEIDIGEFQDLEVFKRIGDSLFSSDESTLDRYRLIWVGLNLFSDAPIFGHGLNQFSVVSGIGYYSHNNFVELLVSGGVFALFIYVYVVYGELLRIGLKNNFWIAIVLFYVYLALDFTGVSYGDRGTQVIVCCSLLLCSRRFSHEN